MNDITVALPDLESLWRRSYGDPRVCVAMLDGPVDRNHPALVKADLTELESVTRRGRGASLRHGTHVASVIWGQHGGAVRGIAPLCRGLLVPVFGDGPDGSVTPCSQLDLARAISLAVQHGANVINISGGQLDGAGQAQPLLANTIRRCISSGVVIVAAAGNDGCDCVHVPAALPGVIAVGAMSASGAPLAFSNWGGSYRQQGVLALGERIVGAAPGGRTEARTGTSAATPIVTGVVALLLSVQLRRTGKLDAARVRQAIFSSLVGCEEQPIEDCRRLLLGRLGISGALAHLEEGPGNMETQDHEISISSDTEQPPFETSSGGAPVLGPLGAGVRRPSSLHGAVRSFSGRRDGSPGVNPSNAEESAGESGSPAPACTTCGNGSTMSVVYALGQIEYDFGSEANRDSLVQSGLANPHDPAQVLAYLQKNPSHAASLTWVLSQDGVPIYAIQPAGPFAAEVYGRLREFVSAHLNEGAERCSLPGVLSGRASLLSGQSVPVVFPEPRGMYCWETAGLVHAVAGESPADAATGEAKARFEKKVGAVRNFLERTYYEVRNLGLTPAERALNWAVTNASNAARIFESALRDEKELDSVEVERSPIAREGADCWDVKLTFFNPSRRLDEARRVYRFCVDVAGIIPVTVGEVRQWHVY